MHAARNYPRFKPPVSGNWYKQRTLEKCLSNHPNRLQKYRREPNWKININLSESLL